MLRGLDDQASALEATARAIRATRVLIAANARMSAVAEQTAAWAASMDRAKHAGAITSNIIDLMRAEGRWP
ncbi:MAG TPA: hypothetical protein PKY87_08840 [Terricaulis sp.]|nr:hypothetical protein [Terricaulis sp.]